MAAPGDTGRRPSTIRSHPTENRARTVDLYTFAFTRLGEIQFPANVHYTDGGYHVLAERVVATIQVALGSVGTER
jgi:hypothetical protein